MFYNFFSRKLGLHLRRCLGFRWDSILGLAIRSNKNLCPQTAFFAPQVSCWSLPQIIFVFHYVLEL